MTSGSAVSCRALSSGMTRTSTSVQLPHCFCSYCASSLSFLSAAVRLLFFFAKLLIQRLISFTLYLVSCTLSSPNPFTRDGDERVQVPLNFLSASIKYNCLICTFAFFSRETFWEYQVPITVGNCKMQSVEFISLPTFHQHSASITSFRSIYITSGVMTRWLQSILVNYSLFRFKSSGRQEVCLAMVESLHSWNKEIVKWKENICNKNIWSLTCHWTKNLTNKWVAVRFMHNQSDC